MYVFIWNDADYVSDGYGERGGVVIVAASLDRAVGMARERGVVFLAGEAFAYRAIPVDGGAAEEFFIFPSGERF